MRLRSFAQESRTSRFPLCASFSRRSRSVCSLFLSLSLAFAPPTYELYLHPRVSIVRTRCCEKEEALKEEQATAQSGRRIATVIDLPPTPTWLPASQQVSKSRRHDERCNLCGDRERPMAPSRAARGARRQGRRRPQRFVSAPAPLHRAPRQDACAETNAVAARRARHLVPTTGTSSDFFRFIGFPPQAVQRLC